jgi:hypothetical protein
VGLDDQQCSSMQQRIGDDDDAIDFFIVSPFILTQVIPRICVVQVLALTVFRVYIDSVPSSRHHLLDPTIVQRRPKAKAASTRRWLFCFLFIIFACSHMSFNRKQIRDYRPTVLSHVIIYLYTTT